MQFQKQLEMFGLGEGMEKFLDYLKSEKCNELFRCNKISIDFDIGNISLTMLTEREYF